MNAREQKLISRHLLDHQDEIDVCFKNKEWANLAALVRYAQQDAPKSLIHTDPALSLLQIVLEDLRARIRGMFDTEVVPAIFCLSPLTKRPIQRKLPQNERFFPFLPFNPLHPRAAGGGRDDGP